MTALVWPALAMGLFGGAHCVAMCGGASSLLCASGPRGRFALFYNAGRVAGYALLGLAAGALGALPLGGSLDVLRFGLRALAAICMLAVGLHLVGLPSFVRALESAGGPLWRRLAPLAKRLLPLRSRWQALAAGALWAFMPCGLLYGAVALAASAGSAAAGALTMAAFAAGTLPAMLAVGIFASGIARAMAARTWLRRVAGGLVLAFGLYTTAGLLQQTAPAHGAHACCPRR